MFGTHSRPVYFLAIANISSYKHTTHFMCIFCINAHRWPIPGFVYFVTCATVAPDKHSVFDCDNSDRRRANKIKLVNDEFCATVKQVSIAWIATVPHSAYMLLSAPQRLRRNEIESKKIPLWAHKNYLCRRVYQHSAKNLPNSYRQTP